jgi:hypothetical protein
MQYEINAVDFRELPSRYRWDKLIGKYSLAIHLLDSTIKQVEAVEALKRPLNTEFLLTLKTTCCMDTGTTRNYLA